MVTFKRITAWFVLTTPTPIFWSVCCRLWLWGRGAGVCCLWTHREQEASVHLRLASCSLQSGRKQQFRFLVILWGNTVCVLGVVCLPRIPVLTNSGGRRIESLKTAWALQTSVSKSKNKETMPRGGVEGLEKALSGLVKYLPCKRGS